MTKYKHPYNCLERMEFGIYVTTDFLREALQEVKDGEYTLQELRTGLAKAFRSMVIQMEHNRTRKVNEYRKLRKEGKTNIDPDKAAGVLALYEVDLIQLARKLETGKPIKYGSGPGQVIIPAVE